MNRLRKMQHLRRGASDEKMVYDWSTFKQYGMKKPKREQSLSIVAASPGVMLTSDHGPALGKRQGFGGTEGSGLKDDAPVVTLLSDFGNRDGYVAQMKLAILASCPTARLVDVTHEISPQDVVAGAIVLEQVIAGATQVQRNLSAKDFSAQDMAATLSAIIHLAVVDPGVGTGRQMIVAQVAGQWIVCPDNGLITWAWRRHSPRVAYELSWRPRRSSSTFHGRDIMGPVAGMLAGGMAIASLIGNRVKPMLLPMQPAKPRAMRGRVIHVDHFGNAMTNLTSEGLARMPAAKASGKKKNLFVWTGGKSVGPIRRTYGDVKPGEPVALIGSSGLLEIAVCGGSAARELGLSVGDMVELKNVV